MHVRARGRLRDAHDCAWDVLFVRVLQGSLARTVLAYCGAHTSKVAPCARPCWHREAAAAFGCNPCRGWVSRSRGAFPVLACVSLPGCTPGTVFAHVEPQTLMYMIVLSVVVVQW